MTRYTFDPRRLASHQSDPYQAAGQILRDVLGGGDVFAEVRRRARRDPRLREMLLAAAAELALAAALLGPTPEAAEP